MTEERLSEYCGVFGCVAGGDGPKDIDVAEVICLGLVALQHRGQESAGIVTTNGGKNDEFSFFKGRGQVSHVFNDDNMAKLKGKLGIGHTRYSTAGGTEPHDFQPFIIHTIHGVISIAHNGQLINASSLRKKVLERGVGLSTGTDSEIVAQLLTLSPPGGEPHGPDWPARIKNLMNSTPLAYSLVIMHHNKIFAIRDPFGNRPLCLGTIETSRNNEGETDSWVVSSESCSFQSIGAKYLREVKPGEIVEISNKGIKSMCVVNQPLAQYSAFCIFEYVYFSRADSILEGQMVYTVRQQCGKQLAIEAPVDADLVSTVPESATPAAMGYSKQSGLPYVEVLCKNRYVGRTFIQPSERLRKIGVAKKFGVLTDNLKDKKIVLIDDSIVRGNTIGPIVNLMKEGGAKEVHIRVASPPIKHPCYMGINIPTREELIANRYNVEEMTNHFGVDSIVYLSVDGLVSAVRSGIKSQDKGSVGHCTACLTGEYPVSLNW